MAFRTRTSEKTMKIYKAFEVRDHLQPFILAKLSIALSIKRGFRYVKDELEDGQGLDLNRQTITGEYDLLFKTLIEVHENRHITDEEFFPNVVKAYLDNGATLLDQEYKYSNDFYIHLVELEKGI